MYFNEKTAKQLTLVAVFKAKEGKSAQLQDVLVSLIDVTRAEDGCVCYHLYRDIEDYNTFVYHEIWEDEAAWLKHMEQPHLKAALVAIEPMIAVAPKLSKFERSDAPNPVSEKGMLVLFAYNHSKEGVEAEWQKLLEGLIAPTLAEKGAMHYELHRDRENKCAFMFHETWQTVESWNNHMKAPHLVEFLGIMDNYAIGGIELIKAEIIK